MTIVISCILNFAKLGLKVASGVRYIFLKVAAAVARYNFLCLFNTNCSFHTSGTVLDQQSSA